MKWNLWKRYYDLHHVNEQKNKCDLHDVSGIDIKILEIFNFVAFKATSASEYIPGYYLFVWLS